LRKTKKRNQIKEQKGINKEKKKKKKIIIKKKKKKK
jgi:hypothetical protein